MTDSAFAEPTAIALPAAPFAGATALPGGFVASATDRDDWRAAPIEPSWIIDGRPEAEIVPIAAGADGLSSVVLWRCSEGTFRWRFDWEETVHILDGEVEVTLPSGASHRLVPGSIAVFPARTTAVWRVVRPVRKLAVCRAGIHPRLTKLVKALGYGLRMLGFRDNAGS